jgi:hypothetical protein
MGHGARRLLGADQIGELTLRVNFHIAVFRLKVGNEGGVDARGSRLNSTIGVPYTSDNSGGSSFVSAYEFI